MYLNNKVSVSIAGYATVMFHDNRATRDGGALYTIDNNIITIKDHCLVHFGDNEVEQYGGAVHCDTHSHITLKGNALVNFTKNIAKYGGAISVLESTMLHLQNSTTWYGNNTATRNGGVMYLSNSFSVSFSDDANIKFYYNNCTQYGGAIYADLTQENTLNKIAFHSNTDFYKNDARVGSSVYVDIQDLCNKTCLNNSVLGINKESLAFSPFGDHISTPPSKLVFYEPEAKCIDDDDNDTDCMTYLVKKHNARSKYYTQCMRTRLL